MKTNLQKITYWTSVSVVGVILGITLQFAKAWTEPTLTAPNGNVGAPINTGANSQRKVNGTLQVDNSIVAGINSTTKATPVPNGVAAGNMYANDVWIAGANGGAGKWASQGSLQNPYYQEYKGPLITYSDDNYASNHFISCTDTDAAAYCGLHGSVLVSLSCKDVGGNAVAGINYNTANWSLDDHFSAGGNNRAIDVLKCGNYYGEDIVDKLK